jgi:hypothetical protein
VFVQDKYAAGEWFLESMLISGETTHASIDSKLEQAVGKAWVCRDGYLHQWTLMVVPAELIGLSRFDMFIRIYDLNADIEITAPASASEAPEGDATERVRGAIAKTKDLDSYRFEVVTVSQGKEVERVQGQVQDKDVQYTTRTPEGMTKEEIVVSDGQIYRRDPDSGTAWQIVPESERAGITESWLKSYSDIIDDSPTATHFNGWKTPFAWKGKETLAGISCDIYLQCRKPYIGAYYELTVCPDGYWHRGQMTITMEAGDFSELLSVTLTTNLFDLNVPVSIPTLAPSEIVTPAPTRTSTPRPTVTPTPPEDAMPTATPKP